MPGVAVTDSDMLNLTPLILCTQFVAENPDVYQKLVLWARSIGAEMPPVTDREMAMYLNHAAAHWLRIQNELRNGDNLRWQSGFIFKGYLT